jgi:predicted MFS family arabinose efflux permease
MGRDLRMTIADLGIAVAAFFGATALSAAVLGRVVQRIGVHRGLVGAMAAAAVAFAFVSVVRTPVMLDIAMIFCGFVNGAVHPCANALLATGRGERRAQSFGIKQASSSGAALLAGLLVPAVALTVGWRWSFVAICAVSASLALLSRSLLDGEQLSAASGRSLVTSRDARVPVGVLALAGVFGAAAGNAFAAFFVVFGVHAEHVPQSTAALAFSLSSLCGIVGRVTSGRVIDRRGYPATVVASCLVACGAVGDLLLASHVLSGISLLLVGGIVVTGIGWAWPGLLHYSVSVRDPQRVARSTGIMMTGFAIGACLGPLLLGQLFRKTGYADVWRVGALLNLCASATLFLGPHIRRSTAPVSV